MSCRKKEVLIVTPEILDMGFQALKLSRLIADRKPIDKQVYELEQAILKYHQLKRNPASQS